MVLDVNIFGYDALLAIHLSFDASMLQNIKSHLLDNAEVDNEVEYPPHTRMPTSCLNTYPIVASLCSSPLICYSFEKAHIGIHSVIMVIVLAPKGD